MATRKGKLFQHLGVDDRGLLGQWMCVQDGINLEKSSTIEDQEGFASEMHLDGEVDLGNFQPLTNLQIDALEIIRLKNQLGGAVGLVRDAIQDVASFHDIIEFPGPGQP